jgi:hypothetical protein
MQTENAMTMTYEAWRATQQWPHTSFDSYLFAHPEVREYQVFRLDPTTKMSHIEGEPLLETDNLAEACTFIYDAFRNEGAELCVFQPRTQGYCDYYRKSNKHAKRASTGRFVKA